MRSFIPRALAICLTLCLLSSAAFAAATQSLEDFLLDEGIDMADAQARAHVLAIGDAKRALDVEITLEGLYFDGTKLLIGWRTENLTPQKPALVLYTEVQADGVPLRADADHPVSSWWPAMFGLFVAGDPINSLMGRFIIEDAAACDLSGTVEFSAYFVVKRPTKPVVVTDPEIHIPYDHEGTETDRQAMLEAMQAYGVTVADADDTDIQAWREKGYLVVNRFGEHFPQNGAEGVSALTGADLPDTADEEIVLTFQVDLDALAGK